MIQISKFILKKDLKNLSRCYEKYFATYFFINIYFYRWFSRNYGLNFNTLISPIFGDNELLNTRDSYIRTDSENNSFSPNIYFSRKFSKKGRELHANMNSSISENKENRLNRSENIFYTLPATSDNRNQYSVRKNFNDNYRFSVGYSEPLSDSLNIGLNVNYNSSNTRSLRDVNDFDTATQDYSVYNEILSNRLNQKIDQITP